MSKLLCSYREAAKLLGIGRSKGLHELIAKGVLRPVKVLTRWKIPREQIEEFARTGEEMLKVTPPKAPKKPVKRSSIADLDLDNL